MKNLLCSALALTLWVLPATGQPAQLDELIAEVRSRYAPDKRTAVFDIKAGKDSLSNWYLTGETNQPKALDELLAKSRQKGLAPESRVVLLPAASLEGHHWGVVSLSACNIRSQPRHAAELATQSTLGTALRVLKREGGWYLVQTPDDYLGWLDDGGFALLDSAGYERWQAAPKVVYLPDMGFARQSPSADAPFVSDLLAGNILLDLGREGAFAKIGFPDGRQAYVPAADVVLYPQWLYTRQPTVENILATAHRFMGRPYLWGGTSGKGVDCSGFTKTVFYLNGLLLPRDASQQVHTGIDIPADTTLANLQPGDLLFYGRHATADTPEKVTHVAIYLGNGQIIHGSGAVKVESMRRGDPTFVEDRLGTYLRGRRVLEEPEKYGVRRVGE
ncbi:MAG: C40 family peptidase [Saprospiraceae bacterium]|nr:C40 family peptidase [Saprospiraceae bacterium]